MCTQVQDTAHHASASLTPRTSHLTCISFQAFQGMFCGSHSLAIWLQTKTISEPVRRRLEGAYFSITAFSCPLSVVAFTCASNSSIAAARSIFLANVAFLLDFFLPPDQYFVATPSSMLVGPVLLLLLLLSFLLMLLLLLRVEFRQS